MPDSAKMLLDTMRKFLRLTDTQLHKALSVGQLSERVAAIALNSSEAENGCAKHGKFWESKLNHCRIE